MFKRLIRQRNYDRIMQLNAKQTARVVVHIDVVLERNNSGSTFESPMNSSVMSCRRDRQHVARPEIEPFSHCRVQDDTATQPVASHVRCQQATLGGAVSGLGRRGVLFLFGVQRHF